MSTAAFTEESTSRTAMVGDMPVHYHDVGRGRAGGNAALLRPGNHRLDHFP